jgi:branched-chain amino acid transport system ATP-binding protein
MAENSDTEKTPLLEVRDVAVRFDGIIALAGMSFKLQKGHVLGLIAPNGAGKTTMFNYLSHLYTPTSGDVLFEGMSILGRPAHAQIGIGRTFQNVAPFPRLTVRENC